MSHPSFIDIRSIQCNATDDFTGQDDLVAVLGADRFPLGSFTEGSTVAVGVSRPIMLGVTELVVVEEDFTGDDMLGSIDLLVDMDVERVVGIFGATARYDITFLVSSEPDVSDM